MEELIDTLDGMAAAAAGLLPAVVALIAIVIGVGWGKRVGGKAS